MGECLVYVITGFWLLGVFIGFGTDSPLLGLFSLGMFIYFIYMIIKAKQDIADGTYARQQEEERRKIEQERIFAEQSQRDGAPWSTRYYTFPCPYCGHYRVRPAKWDDKRMSVAFWGAASSKIGTRYKCERCNRMWS